MNTSDIEFCKNLLLKRKEQIQKNISSYNEEIQNIKAADIKEDVECVLIENKITVNETLNIKQIKEIAEIEASLSKIDNNTFGICEMCEEDIDIERLKVKPHAKYCIICREIFEKAIS